MAGIEDKWEREAAQYRKSWREQFEDLDLRLQRLPGGASRFNEGGLLQRELLDFREQRRALEHPLDELLARLKERLETIATQMQRQARARN